MRARFTLDEKDVKQAILEYVKKTQGVELTSVTISYYKADSRDPREHSYVSAEVS